MLVQDIIDLCLIRYNNITTTKNTTALIKIIYLGVSELFRRFNLSIKTEVVLIHEGGTLYELRFPDVSLLLGLFSEEGVPLIQSDIINSSNYDYKQINYKSFALVKPFDGHLVAVYKASPIKIDSATDVIPLPDVMITVLLDYVGFMIHTSVNRDGVAESTIYKKLFDANCTELENQGYRIPLDIETFSIKEKGYV